MKLNISNLFFPEGGSISDPLLVNVFLEGTREPFEHWGDDAFKGVFVVFVFDVGVVLFEEDVGLEFESAGHFVGDYDFSEF